MTNLWLGAEYNGNYGNTETTNELMHRFIKDSGNEKNPKFFTILEAQINCFGSTDNFFFDDVSQIKATGKHTDPGQYALNVVKSVPHHKKLFAEKKPELILIGGDLAFNAYCKTILPELKYDDLVIVKLRNPSPQAHRGKINKWVDNYNKFQATLPKKKGLVLLHLKCSNIDSNFELNNIAP